MKVRNVKTYATDFGEWKQEYELELTNFEVGAMFRHMIRKWFSRAAEGYNDFMKALLLDDVKSMNNYMNKVAMATFSYFDTGKNPSDEEPERFYHGEEKELSDTADAALRPMVLLFVGKRC